MPVAASGPTAQMSVSPIAISTNGIFPFMPNSFHCFRNVDRSPADRPPTTTSGFACRIFRMKLEKSAVFSGTSSDADLGAADCLQILARRAQDVLAERIGCGDMIPLLADTSRRKGPDHPRLHRNRCVQPERVTIAILTRDLRRRRIVADERDLQLRGGGFLGQRIRRQRSAEDGDDLVLLHQLLHVLRRSLRRGLIQPDQFGRLAHEHVLPLLHRHERAVGEVFRLRSDLPGLRQQHPDTDRLCRTRDVWRRQQRRAA